MELLLGPGKIKKLKFALARSIWMYALENGCNLAKIGKIAQVMRNANELGEMHISTICVCDSLNKMRALDDKIIYALNTAIPTDSFRELSDAKSKCQELFSKIQNGHSQREIAIKKCILSSAEKVKQLKEIRDFDVNNIENLKNLKSEQTRLRLLQSELSVEEVVKERTQKIFNERCRNYYKPNTF